MKPSLRTITRLTLTLAAILPAAAALAQTPIFESRFNSATDMELQYGAALGGGVSGQKDDSSYLGDSSKASDRQKGPLASAAVNNPADPMDEFTITVWYKARQTLRNDAVLFDLLSTVLIWEEKSSQWVLRIDTKPAGDLKPSSYWFRPSNKPPMGGWATPDEWNFLAVVWKRADKKVSFYQGGNSAAATLAKDATRPEDVEPLKERAGSIRVIGNAAGKANDRSFDGNIDDLRFYSTALSDAAIEKIRQADLKNKAPVLP